MNAEEEYIDAIKKLDSEHREAVIGILREIKRMKERGFDESNKEMLAQVVLLRMILGLDGKKGGD